LRRENSNEELLHQPVLEVAKLLFDKDDYPSSRHPLDWGEVRAVSLSAELILGELTHQPELVHHLS
jgi:hypothetical protein